MKSSPIPAPVTIVALLVLSLTITNAIRTGAAIASWDTLQQYEPHPGPLYILLTGAVWAIAGGTLFISLGRRQPWTRTGLTIAGALYVVYLWADRLIFQARVPPVNGFFFLIVTILGLAYLLIVIWGPAGHNFLEKREGHD